MKTLGIIALYTVLVFLCGCVAVATNSTTLAVKSAPRDELRPLAEDGDAQAQYELGKSHCCMGPGFDTQTATAWLCKSAHQGNADAMYELGRIYLGEISRTPAPGQKLRRAMTAKESLAHAHMWLSLASQMGHAEAKEALLKLQEKIGKEERAYAIEMTDTWQDQPCEYGQVFPPKS